MIVALGFCPADVDEALSLLDFIGQLGGVNHYDCLLVADAGVDWGKGVDALTLANRAFRSATIITTEGPVVGWPQGANALWLKAAQYARDKNVSFLWMEPDSIPVKRGWLIAIDKCKSDGYFGHIYPWPQQAKQILSGIAVYPPDAVELISSYIALNPHQAWDVAASDAIMLRATPTKLIQHFYGEKDLAPTFIELKSPSSPRNAFTLGDIHAETVLFHRNKDGSLQQQLRRRLGMAGPGNFVVVLPFWNGDVELLIRNLDWMVMMGMARTHDCLLSYDNTTLRDSIKRVEARARDVFCSIQHTSYAVPHGTRFAATAAWQHAAKKMHVMFRNWLWLEPDAIPLKPNWLTVLQTIYDNSKSLFCGPVVPGMGHLNGTAIYPANTPELLPRTMSHTQNAWDVEAKDEMAGNVKDIGHIFYAAWGTVDGKLDPLTGDSPTFPPGSPLLNQIPKTAVVFHRNKDGSLIQRLEETIR